GVHSCPLYHPLLEGRILSGTPSDEPAYQERRTSTRFDIDRRTYPMSSTTPDLFTPVRLGALELPNRIVLAPLPRNRAGEGNVPTDRGVQYYQQRASGGLLITEATQVTPEGQGYPNTPGIHSDEQVAGWKRVTDAVHAAGGRIVLQLWHVGRIS